MRIELMDEFVVEAVSVELCRGVCDDGGEYVAIEITPNAVGGRWKCDEPPRYLDNKIVCLYDAERFSFEDALIDAEKRIATILKTGQADMRDLAIYYTIKGE